MALSTAWERVATKTSSHLSPDGGRRNSRRPPLGSGWLRRSVATCRQTVGGFTRAAIHRLGADGYALTVTIALRLQDGKGRSS